MSDTITINDVLCYSVKDSYVVSKNIRCRICNEKPWAYYNQHLPRSITDYIRGGILQDLGDGYYLANCYSSKCRQEAKLNIVCPKL